MMTESKDPALADQSSSESAPATPTTQPLTPAPAATSAPDTAARDAATLDVAPSNVAPPAATVPAAAVQQTAVHEAAGHEAAVHEAAAAHQVSPEAGAPSVATPAPPTTPTVRPARRILIGSQRDQAARASSAPGQPRGGSAPGRSSDRRRGRAPRPPREGEPADRATPSQPAGRPPQAGEHADAASLAQPRCGDAPRTAIPRADEPDLEQELAAALGDAPVDQLLDVSASAAPAGELEAETRRVARVVSLHREDVFVDLGDRCQGVLPLKQFAEPPEPGATLEVVVRSFNREHGLYDVSIPGVAVDVGDWSGLIEGEVVEVLVTAQNKGGLECEVAGIRGFIPASQASLYRADDLAALVGQRLACVVSEARREKRNLVLSRRAVLEREKAEQRKSLIATIAPGQVHEGVVRSLQDYGAFVDLGGLDGLIHVSQISWSRIRHPSEVLEPGQHVRVKVLKVNAETGKVSLGLKDLADNPWATAAVRYTSGDIVTGTVSKLAEFGAFVELEPAVEGLVHISELAHHRVFRVSDVLTVGQEVSIKVLSVDPAARRISLSIKATEAKPERPRRPEPEPEVVEAQTARKKRATSLKGGVGGKSGGAQFGLKW